MTARTIDLNCDLGEVPELIASGVDRALLGVVSSANIACGAHAGDETTMRQSVRDAIACGVAIGAHPGYPDRPNFGRLEVAMSPEEIEASVRTQVAALGTIARAEGADLTHVKPHGALYHAANARPEVARAIARAAAAWSTSLALVGQAGLGAIATWTSMGCRTVGEAFADRRYERDGTLRARSQANAMFHEGEDVAAQALRLALGQGVVVDGAGVLAVDARTICVHGDTPHAVRFAHGVRAALERAGVRVRALGVS